MSNGTPQRSDSFCCSRGDFIAQFANVSFFQESFEGPPGVTYTLDTAFDDDNFDFFDRYLVPDLSNDARDDFSGFDGSYAILSQDHDDGNKRPKIVHINIPGIDISGIGAPIVSLLAGALNSEPEFNNYEHRPNFDQEDGIRIFASIDGGTSTMIGGFRPNDTSQSDLYEDTDLDDIGDGARLTVVMSDFSFPVGGFGNLLDLSIELQSDSSFEPLAIDNIRLVVAPEPTSVMIVLGLCGILLAMRRRWVR